MNYRDTRRNAMPNIIERLEQLDEICTKLRSIAEHECNDYSSVEVQISNLEGIIGEILTMIDGR